jgi:GNAT superfamily N-acetyltransferase
MEAAMETLGQPPLVMLREGDESLDAVLSDAGYEVIDPVVLYAAPVGLLTGPLPPVSAFAHWPRLAITEELWATGGIGPSRLGVMDRVTGPKTAILARSDDSPAGAAFVAIHEGIAMVHALEVDPGMRRKGAARNMMRATANWAQDLGASHLSLVVTERNQAARPLYASLGLQVVGHYHYRIREPAKGRSS